MVGARRCVRRLIGGRGLLGESVRDVEGKGGGIVTELIPASEDTY
jgi:hypothetical protein